MTGSSARHRHRHRPPVPWRGLLVLILILGGAIAAFVVVQRRADAEDRRREAASEFVAAYAKRDTTAMWRLLDASSARRYPAERFRAEYRQSDRAAGVERVIPGRPGELRDGRVRVPIRVRTDDYGTLRGTMTLHVSDEDGAGRVRWTPAMRLPGLRDGERVRRRAGPRPTRANVLHAGGGLLTSVPEGAGMVGQPAAGGKPATGLERIYDDRLGGRPASSLYFGDRLIKRVRSVRGRSVKTTIRPALQRAANSALGSKLGGIAVVRPRDGAILALSGLAVSAPQPPGSTFKIITLAAALQNGVASPASAYPARRFATLSGRRLRNAGDGSCGGSLATSFAESCNSVFAPLGAKLGARRLVAATERFGFNETPRVPAAKPSLIPRDLRDDLAVGAAAIGQERVVATPLQMASVGATIANRGVRVRPRIVASDGLVRRRVVRSRVAGVVRDMMLGVVRGGTGTAAALPGVAVAGKTGTAAAAPRPTPPPIRGIQTRGSLRSRRRGRLRWRSRCFWSARGMAGRRPRRWRGGCWPRGCDSSRGRCGAGLRPRCAALPVNCGNEGEQVGPSRPVRGRTGSLSSRTAPTSSRFPGGTPGSSRSQTYDAPEATTDRVGRPNLLTLIAAVDVKRPAARPPPRRRPIKPPADTPRKRPAWRRIPHPASSDRAARRGSAAAGSRRPAQPAAARPTAAKPTPYRATP